MSISRRDFLKISGTGMGGMLAAPSIVAPPILSASKPDISQSHSMLYDATKCVGCRACQVACKRRSDLPPETDAEKIHEMPQDLSADTWTLIKLYKGDEGYSYVKAQCMHCIEPACVSVCPVAALEKLESGPVVYHAERCIGCRYCMAACPFSVPKAQWYSNLPKIQKCDMCADRLEKGEKQACGEACPTGALISGTRGEMLDIAHQRINDSPVYTKHVYGETEAGGVNMLYISRIAQDKLGLPALPGQSLPAITWPYMAAVPWVVTVVAGLMTGIYFYTHRNEDGKEVDHGH